MNKLYSILIFLFLFVISSCGKKPLAVDKCKDIVCANDGTCSEGACVCPQGYSGDHCENILQGAAAGIISPEAVVTSVVLTAIGTSETYQTGISPYGNFWFTNIKPGEYTLHINTVSLYWPSPPDTNIIIHPGDTTDAGYITVTRNEAAQGTVLFSIDGGPDHTLSDNNFVGYNHHHALGFRGYEEYGVNMPYYAVELHIVGFNAPGNYIIDNASYLEVRHNSPGSMDGYWKAGSIYSNAIVNISSIDTTTKKFSGTFSGTLTPINSSVDSIHISGSFTDIYWLL